MIDVLERMKVDYPDINTDEGYLWYLRDQRNMACAAVAEEEAQAESARFRVFRRRGSIFNASSCLIPVYTQRLNKKKANRDFWETERALVKARMKERE